MVTSKKAKPLTAVQRRIAQLERELATVDAEIMRLEQAKLSGRAEHDNFTPRRRAPLFQAWRSERWH